jgi:hypothetical protein
MGTPPEALRAFTPLWRYAPEGDAASAAGRPLRGSPDLGARQFQVLRS